MTRFKKNILAGLFLFLPLAGLLAFVGCNSRAGLPVAPVRVANLTVSVPIPSSARASLLSASSNEILYNLSPTVAGSAPVTGKFGPFSTSGVSGTVDFTIQLTTGLAGSQILALQLNDATTHSPLAIGASALTITSGGANTTVELGSVIRNCYFVSNMPVSGTTYSFDTNTQGPVTTGDVSFGPGATGFEISDVSVQNNIAYMGNGNLVNYAYVPPVTQFWTTSLGAKGVLDIAAGDVFCIHLSSGAHVWLQVVNPGVYNSIAPTFRFRLNRNLNYYAYDPTTCDWNGRTPTPTFTPTNTATPTISSTATNSPTITPSNSPTNTPTITVTSSFTNTTTNSPTATNSNTATNTPTSTVTNTSTNTPTATATGTITAGIANITANIDGAPVIGNTTGGTDNYTEPISIFNSVSLGSSFHPLAPALTVGSYTVYNYGIGAPDMAYQFTLSSPKSLFVSLCGASFDTLLYIRTNPTDPNTTVAFNDDSNFCGNGGTSSSLVTGILQPGTYYVIVDGYQSGEEGTYSLSLSTFNPICGLSPVSAPVPEVEPNNDDSNFSNATDLGTVSANADLVGKGHASFFLDSADVWHFHTSADGAAHTVALDCFDNGTGKAIVGFDLYSFDGTYYTLIDSSNDNGEPNQVTDTLMAGDYYVAVYAMDSGASEADYHLVVQTGPMPTLTVTDTPTVTETPAGTDTYTPTLSETPTATNSPTITLTPTVTSIPSDITANIDGLPVTGDTTGLPDSYNDNGFGNGSSDIAYSFTLASPKSLFISLCGSTNIYTSLYVRTNPSDPNTDIAFDESSACGYPSQLVTGTLQAGVTYYVIVDGYGYGNYYGPFTLSLATFNITCSLLPVSAPVTEVEPNNDDSTFTNATNLGTVSNGTDAVGVGRVNEFGDIVDVWHFTAATDMGVDTISLDCFDDGTGKARVGFDIYDPSGNLVAVSPDGDPLDQVIQVLPAGEYYVAVYSWDTTIPNASYRLVVQGGPASTSPTPTPTITSTVTDTPTLTPTLTITPTPPAPADITSSIDGAPVTGDTTGLADKYNQFIFADSHDYGSGSPDVAYKFTLSAPKNLYIVANTSFSGSLYLRTNPADPSTTFAFDQYFNYIDSYPALVTGTLPAGTYYVIVDGYGSGNFGTFSLSLSTFTPACSLSPLSAPVTAVEPNNDPSFLKTNFLGTVSNGTDAVGKGNVYYYFDKVDNWHFKTGTNGGTYVISLDCFDDGNGKFAPQFQVFNSHRQSIGSSSGGATLVQYNGFLPTGDYYVQVTANNYGAPSGGYRLVIQGFPPPTATFTATATNTPTITPTPLTPLTFFGSQGTGLGYLANPFGLAVNSAGTTVYVSDYNNNYVQVFTGGGSSYAATSQWGSYGTGQFNFYNPHGLALDSAGNIYVVDTNNSRVQEYNSAGTTFLQQFGFFISSPTNGDLIAPANVAVDGAGNVYVSNDNTNSLNQPVAKYNSNGSWNSYWNMSANFNGIAVNSAGTTVYVTDSYTLVKSYSSDGTTLYNQWNGSASGTPFNGPYGITLGPDGYLYVADIGNDRIVKFDASGNYLSQLGGSMGSLPGQFNGPTAVAVDGSYNVYVLDTYNYRVQKFAPF